MVNPLHPDFIQPITSAIIEGEVGRLSDKTKSIIDKAIGAYNRYDNSKYVEYYNSLPKKVQNSHRMKEAYRIAKGGK